MPAEFYIGKLKRAMKKRIFFLFLLTQQIAFAFTVIESDTDLFVLKNGYSFKADLVDTSGKYYVYKVYRGERLLRCVKKNEVSVIKFNFVTPPMVRNDAKQTATSGAIGPVAEKKKFNPYTNQLKVRKGFEVIDTVRLLYDQDMTRYKPDENGVSAFSTAVEMGPKFTQEEIDTSGYQGAMLNGKRNGRGTLYFNNGALFTGKMENNVMQGYGYYSDEIIDYKGMFANSMLNGLGVCYYFGIEDVLKDIVFKGEFKDGKFWEGELYYTTTDEKRYVQPFKQGNPNAARLYEE